MMQWELVLLGYVITVVYLLGRSEYAAYREIKSTKCTRKKFNDLEYYECVSDGFYSYKMLNGKKLLFREKDEDSFAYHHELGHLLFDKFQLDILLAAALLIPLLLLPTPWAWIGAFVVYITAKWIKKNEERRADIFAYSITHQKYTPIKLEKNKLILLLHWLFWSHTPEKVRIMNEYYKKEIPLTKLFFKSIFSS